MKNVRCFLLILGHITCIYAMESPATLLQENAVDQPKTTSQNPNLPGIPGVSKTDIPPATTLPIDSPAQWAAITETHGRTRRNSANFTETLNRLLTLAITQACMNKQICVACASSDRLALLGCKTRSLSAPICSPCYNNIKARNNACPLCNSPFSQ